MYVLFNGDVPVVHVHNRKSKLIAFMEDEKSNGRNYSRNIDIDDYIKECGYKIVFVNNFEEFLNDEWVVMYSELDLTFGSSVYKTLQEINLKSRYNMDECFMVEISLINHTLQILNDPT